MILLTALYIANIVVIWIVISYLIYLILSMPYGFYWSITRALVYKDYRGIRFIQNNPVYMVYVLFSIVLFLIFMTLVGQLMHSDILSKPIFNFVLSPIVWVLVYLHLRLTDKKIKQLS